MTHAPEVFLRGVKTKKPGKFPVNSGISIDKYKKM